MRKLVLFAFLLAIAPGQTWGATAHDYYDPTTQVQRLLNSNENHHLRPGIEKLGRALLENSPNLLEYAEAEFLYMLRNFPNHPNALHYMSKVQIARGFPAKAEHYFIRAIQLYPNHPNTFTVYGVFLREIGKLDEAIPIFNNALSLDSHSAGAAYYLGLTYFDKGDYELANRFAHQAYENGYRSSRLRELLKDKGFWP